MLKSVGTVAVVVALAFIGASAPISAAEGPTVQRKVVLTQDLAIPNYQQVTVEVTIPVGGREGRHTHPGSVTVYVTEGALTLYYEGKPMQTYKPGEAVFIESGKIHEGINQGNTPIKAIASFVVEKGKPLTTQSQ